VAVASSISRPVLILLENAAMGLVPPKRKENDMEEAAHYKEAVLESWGICATFHQAAWSRQL
jgi:hypothetical protein